MRALNVVTLLLVNVSGLNWLLVGLFELDLVTVIFGGQTAGLAKIVYILVGLSASSLWTGLAVKRKVGILRSRAS